MIQPAFDHRSWARFGVFIQQMLFKRPCVYANADRTIVVSGSLDDLFDAGLIADVTRIDTQTCGPCLGGLNPTFVMEMDISDDRHRNLRNNLAQRTAGRLVGHRHPHNIGTGISRCLNLRNRAFDIRG